MHKKSKASKVKYSSPEKVSLSDSDEEIKEQEFKYTHKIYITDHNVVKYAERYVKFYLNQHIKEEDYKCNFVEKFGRPPTIIIKSN